MDTHLARNEYRQAMFSMIENYLIGNQTQKNYCQSVNISFSKFSYWLKKYRNEQKRRSGFIQLNPKDKILQGQCRIELPNGIHIIFNEKANKDIIINLINQAVR